jgi:hypothetical protein
MTFRESVLRLIVPIFVLLWLVAGATPAIAQMKPDSFEVRGGGLVAGFGSNLRLDVNGGETGTTISFENDLGFTKTHTTYFFDGGWRITDRHRLYFSFVNATRDATKAGISEPITIRGTTFQVGANVQAFIDTSYFTIDYGFALVKNDKADVVATIGLSSYKVHTGMGLELQATTGGSISRNLETDATSRTNYPVPGVQMQFMVHPRVKIVGDTRLIKATLNGVTASSVDGRGGVEFPLSSHVGFGGAYYFNRVLQERSSDTFSGKLIYSFHGPQFYGLVHF